MSKKKRDVKELGQEIDILDHMLDALVETLEKKHHNNCRVGTENKG